MGGDARLTAFGRGAGRDFLDKPYEVNRREQLEQRITRTENHVRDWDSSGRTPLNIDTAACASRINLQQ